MSDAWYQAVPATEKLTQGDPILRCPLLRWVPGAAHTNDVAEEKALYGAARIFEADVVVMSQACDLEHGKVQNVVLSPHLPLSEFRGSWERAMQHKGQSPTAKAWRAVCNDIADGYIWNQAFLNRCVRGEGDLQTELRIVDFYDILTVPRIFLEALLARRHAPRLRLLPPYREHLSQAFARFFMRVGLPEPLERMW